ncbi:MAG: phosphate transport system regulatory protein PhoU [Fibrobacteres bacterium CG2_30_45_31]|nr:MAG: phosphate transport system regulatory protein PhoU [Fibrobacteres bacterium CG2_30_45_31]
MRTHFDIQLETLNNEIIEMGALVEQAMSNAVDALLHQSVDLAQKNIDFDKDIDQKMKEIESLCLKLLLSQQPVARDLRLISAALKMVSDLERIGDQCADISEIVLTLPPGADTNHLNLIPRMASATKKMVSESVDAFVNRDMTLARSVCDYDDVVDNLFNEVRRDLISKIRDNLEDGDCIIDLLMIAKYFERIGDHSVNVAKWVIFSITGIRNGVGYLASFDDMKDK